MTLNLKPGYYWVKFDDGGDITSIKYQIGRFSDSQLWYLCDGHWPRTNDTLLKLGPNIPQIEE